MKFSVIIPVYNVAPYLRECLDSVLNQTYTDWEAICVDDGSTDESGAILDEIASRDSRIRVIHQKNSGTGFARNAALNAVSGDWIMFLDSDDVWAPWLLERCSLILKNETRIQVLRIGLQSFNNEAGSVNWGEQNSEQISHYNLIDAREVLDTTSTMSSFTCGCYRRDVVGKVRFGTTRIAQDVRWLFSVMVNVDFIGKTNIVGYGYRQRPGSAVHSAPSRAKAESMIICDSERLRIVANLDKRVPQEIMRLITNGLQESFFAMYNQLSADDQRLLWGEWIDALRVARTNPRINRFNRIRMTIITVLPCYAVAWLMCYLPLWMKRRGLHR